MFYRTNTDLECIYGDCFVVFDEIFFSFTFGGEAVSLAAAKATIKEMENKQLITRTSPLFKFRTGELSAFLDIAKEQKRLGSSRCSITGKP